MKTPGWVAIGIMVLVGCSSSSSKSTGTAGTSGGGTSGGGTGGMGGAGGGTGVTIANFAQKYAEALCAKNFTCCDPSELTGKTQPQCVTDNANVISLFTAEISASQSQGRASYDASSGATCIDSLKAMTCDEFKTGAGANMAACMAFIMPNVAMGGACTQSYECTTNNCQGADTSTTPPTDGTCAAAIPVASIGSSCAASACTDDAYCDATNTCAKKKGVGQTCTSDSECNNSCSSDTLTCTCYAGCMVVEATTTAGTALSILLLGAGLVFARKRRRRG